MQNFYQVLGVAQTASGEEIKKAYRKLARGCHPDIVQANGGDIHEAQERFKRINHARDVLSDADKRAEYDMSLLRPVSSPGPKYRPSSEEPVYSAYEDATFVAPPPYWSDACYTDQSQSHDWYYDLDERIRLEEAWQEFISRPLRWQNLAEAWYGRIGYIIVGVASLVVIGLVLFGGGQPYSLMEYSLTRNSAPGVESHVPLTGFFIGLFVAIALTLGVAAYTAISGWSRLRVSGHIRGRLVSRLLDMLAQLSIICGLSGFFIARYFF